MLLVTANQMRNIDRRTIEEYGITGLELMERAGQGLFEKCVEILKGIPSPRVAVFCGKGNNGGDGYVLARLLAQKKIRAECYLLASEKEITGDALTNLKKLSGLKIAAALLANKGQLPALDPFALVVDAIFGTGFTGIPKDLVAETIRHINQFKGPVLSVDTPTGANMDTGEVNGDCVKASHTVALGFPKVGQYFFPCREYTGELSIHDLGFAAKAVEQENIHLEVMDRQLAKSLLPTRKRDGHKGDFGKVMIVGGSLGMSGAVALAAKAALRSGCGMVTAAVPQCIQPVVAASFSEAMTLALPQTEAGSISLEAYEVIKQKANEWADVLILGPGLGLHPETSALARKLVREMEMPAVVDADAINAFAQCKGEISSLLRIRVLTPHWGEINRIYPMNPQAKGIYRIDELRKITSGEFKNTLLLKGAPTLIASAQGKCFVNPTGNSGLATAGSGDVESGIIAGLMAQGLEAFYAASLGAFLHGLSGDLAARELGEHGLIAGDLIQYLPKAFLDIQNA